MEMLTTLPPPLSVDKHCTWADILATEEECRVELIDGYPTLIMSFPTAHQRSLGGLLVQLSNYLQGKKEYVTFLLAARPFEKKGDPPEIVDTVLYPDIMVVCDPEKMDDYGCIGAPDLVMEVLAPSPLRRDQLTKFKLYQKAGVREYWIVDPDEKFVQIFLFEDKKCFVESYCEKDTVKITVLDDCTIDLSLVFPE